MPRLAEDELAGLYDDAYFEEWLKASVREKADIDRALADHAPRARFLSALHVPGRVLDVGGATGLFAASAGLLGWDVAMVEASPVASGWARRRLNITVVGSSIADVAGEARFDALTFWHSLEHHVDPVAALVAAKRLLAPGGILIVEVPNAGSLQRRLSGPRWSGWHLPYHTVHFTPEALTSAAHRAGLQPERVSFAPFGPLATVARPLRATLSRRRPPSPSHDGLGAAGPLILHQSRRASRVLSVLSGSEMLLVARK